MTTPTTVQVRFQFRADTAANWTSIDPVLLANELGRETDTGKIKIGDGTTAWSSLGYQALGRISDADIATDAEIAVSKLANGSANQILTTDGTDVSWTDSPTIAGNVIISGNLTVNGTETIINVDTLQVEDKTIEMGNVTTPTDLTADGGGIVLLGATNKTILWVDSTDSWTSSENVDLASGKTYKIAGTDVLSATTLGSGVTGSSLTSVGNLTDLTVDTTTLVVDATNDRVGIGVASPSAPLQVQGSAGEIRIQRPTASQSDWSMKLTSSSGEYQIYDNNNTTARLTIDSSGRLLVGTGTADTGVTARYGFVQISGNSGGDTGGYLTLARGAAPTIVDQTLGGIFFTSGADEFGSIRCVSDGGVGSGDAPGRLVFSTTADSESSPTPRMTIKSDGKVGIGSTNPPHQLSVLQGEKINFCALSNGAAYGYITGDNSNNLAFGYGTTETARIDSSGRLLVGTPTAAQNGTAIFQGNNADSTGAAIVHLAKGDATPADGAFLGNLSFTDSGHVQAARITAHRDGGTWTSGSSQPTRLVFSTTANGESSPTERLRIKKDGTIWTFSDSGAHTFDVLTANTAGTTHTLLRGYYGATSIASAATLSFRVYTNGNVQNTNNSYGALSDIKLKENIVDASSQWDDLKAIQVRNYNFKEGQTHTQIGVVAQEVELVSPGLVSESPDRDAEGNDLGTVTKSVNYSVLYMKAVKALQEAMERIETLEAKVAALEGN